MRREALGRVVQTKLVAGSRKNLMLVHDGRNGARDEIPLRIQRDRYHGLELEITLGPVFNGSYVVIVVVLKGDADERGNGVRQLLARS